MTVDNGHRAADEFAADGGTGRRWSRVLVLCLPLVLGACGAIFGDDEEPETVTSDAAAEGDYPRLATVPGTARDVSGEQARAQAVQGLAADRSSARYSDQPLTGNPIGAPAAPEPPPPPQQQAAVPAPPQAPGADGGRQRQTAPPAGLPPLPPQFGAQSQGTAAPGQQQPGRQEMVAVIFFGFGSANLDGNDMQVLRDVANLHRQRGGRIMVIGHASSRTGVMTPVEHQMANFEISAKRANAVADALARLGVPRDQIRTEARSDSQPVYHEFMPTGETGNQRAEIILEG